jgi:hypothetical protein
LDLLNSELSEVSIPARRAGRAPDCEPPMTDPERLPRCCEQHTDWPTLAEHLTVAFSQLSEGDIRAELAEARSVIQRFSLEEIDAIEVAELIVRHQLMLRTGEVPDVARLDPETHIRRNLIVDLELADDTTAVPS